MNRKFRALRPTLAATAAAALMALALPRPALAWWHYGWGPRVAIGIAIPVVPPPAYYPAPPAYYAPPAYPRRIWIPAHYTPRGVWIRGHWAWR